MERNRIESGGFDECGGENVLGGVLLHVIETVRPIEGAGDGAGGDRLLCDVDYVADLVLDHFPDSDAGERA